MILVVGGAGYIGSVLVRELLDRGFSVRVFDRLYFGDRGLREVKDRIELVVGDMRRPDPSIFQGIDVVVNLGGLSNDPTAEYNPRANTEMNTVATGTLGEMAKKAGVRRFIFASSCSVYYVAAGSEKTDPLTEDSPIAPKAAYSKSKFEGERRLLALADKDFTPVIFRQGTVYGFSPRMRYDLVVNTFLKSALTRGVLNLHLGGEMWRPMVDIRDVCRAYISCFQVDEKLIRGQVFNLSFRNYRVSELALHVKNALAQEGVRVDLVPDYSSKGVRSYFVSTEKIERVLGFRCEIEVEESVRHMLGRIRELGMTDFDNPIYYNIQWLKLLEEMEEIIKVTGSVF